MSGTSTSIRPLPASDCRPVATLFLTVLQAGKPRDVPQFKDIGPRETGYALDITSVHASKATLPDGRNKRFTTTFRTWVTHLSTDPLDPRLFDVPTGSRKAFARGGGRGSTVAMERTWS